MDSGDYDENKTFPIGETPQERGFSNVPKCYEISSSDRPSLNPKIADVVVVDLSGLNDPNQRPTIVKNIGNVCRESGFFQIINHGIPQKVLDEALGTAFEFFDLPTSEKAKYMSNDVHKPVRYGTSIKDGVDKIQFWRVFLKHYAHPLNEWIQQWPDKPQDYRNRMAQHLFGYTAAEALGKTPPDLSAGPSYGKLANLLLQRAVKGESWSGEFPIRNKNRELFNVVCSAVPFRDEYGTIVGVLVVATDARQFRELRLGLSAPKRSSVDNFGNDLHKPFQTTVASKITNMASKVMSEMRNSMVRDGRSSDNYDCDFAPSTNYQFIEKRETYSNGASESKPGIHKVLSSKAEAWMRAKGISWPWKEKEKDSSDIRMDHLGWPWL